MKSVVSFAEVAVSMTFRSSQGSKTNPFKSIKFWKPEKLFDRVNVDWEECDPDVWFMLQAKGRNFLFKGYWGSPW